MDMCVYESIVSAITRKSWDFDQVYAQLVQEFPTERKESVRSILSQEYQRHIKKGFKACNNPGRREAVYRSVRQAGSVRLPEGVIVRHAQQAGNSSALTAKMVLEEYLTENTEQTVKPGEYKDQALKSQTSMLMKDTTLIDDGKLAMEIFLATLKDGLTKLEIPFSDENVLRVQGYDKTP